MKCRAVAGLALVVALLLGAPSPSSAQRDTNVSPQVEQYLAARRAFEEVSSAYWQSVLDKRRARNAKRRANEEIQIDDYVLTQPPVYSGPPRPPDLTGPDPTQPPRPEIPVAADFIRHAAEQYRFVPQRPGSEIEFKRAYARAASAAGLTRDQIVRIYAFETGGNGTYDVQSGLTSDRPGAKPISPAIGYNQLLSTNTVGLLAEHGDRYVALLRKRAESLTGDERQAMDRKIAALGRMIAASRSVPNNWNDHDKLAKTTPAGFGIHAAIFDRDLGPLLQVQKLVNSVNFARSKGYRAALTAAELELMNFTGDGNGIDMVMMPRTFREQVPTSNFFQQQGYERNPIARRTGTVAALIASIDAKMDQASQAQGAKDLASAF